MQVSGEMLEMGRVDADLYQQGRDAMQDNGSTLEIPITEAVGEKHIHGFAIAHVQEANASWRLVATDVRTELREDNHQGSPPLMMSGATLSCAPPCFKDGGGHERRIREWDVRTAFFNADLDEIVHVHLGHGVCQFGLCWLLRKALYGTRMLYHKMESQGQ